MACQGASHTHCQQEAKKILDAFKEFNKNLPKPTKFSLWGLQKIVSNSIKNKFICHKWEMYTWILYSCLITNGYEVNWINGTAKDPDFDFIQVEEDVLKVLWEYECETW